MLSILVTGAAGLIGGEVCARLVARGHRVHALVHRTPDVRGNDSALVPVAGVLRGDVTAPGLDLTNPPPIDLVIHCAAALEFDAPDEVLTSINVEGTRNACAFAAGHGASLLHVSTAYVCGPAEGRVMEEPVRDSIPATNRYEASKVAGERVVADSGVPYAIVRPSIVLGDSTTGAIRDFPALCNVFRLMAKGLMPVFPASEHGTLDLVPIDHVAAGIAALTECMDEAQGGIFHLVSGKPLPSRILAEGVAAIPSYPDPYSVDPQDFDPAGLSPAQRKMTGYVVQTFGSYLSRDPRFDDSNLRALTGLSCPPTDAAWMQRMIAYAIERGYLPAP